MPMHIVDPTARFLCLTSYFFERLEQVVYGDLCTDNSEKATELVYKHLLPGKLCEVMSKRIEFDKALEKDAKAFVKVIRS